MRHKMTLGHFSKDLIRPPVSGGQSRDNEDDNENDNEDDDDDDDEEPKLLTVALPCGE